MRIAERGLAFIAVKSEIRRKSRWSTHQSLKTVRENIESIQRRLRDEMRAQKAA
jgi:hypothetical protein